MIVEIQVLPTPAGNDTDHWAHVDAAIGVVAQSGLMYEVGPLGTTFEGDADLVWDTVRRAHEAALAHGVAQVVTVVKLLESHDGSPTMDALTAAHRPTAD